MNLFINYLDVNGLVLNDNINYFLTVTNLFDATRDVISNDMYIDGQSWTRSKTQMKTITLQGVVQGNIATNLYLLKQYLFADTTKVLTIGINGMPTLTLTVDVVNWTSDPNNAQIITCTLVAPDPNLYSQTPQVVSLGALSSNSLTFPFGFPLTFGTLTGAQGTIQNLGSSTAYPVITIVGVCDTLVISNATTGESMSLAISLGATDTLIIDNNPATRSVTLDGVLRMDLKVGTWLSCPVGNNVFNFSRNSVSLANQCSISLLSRWI